MDAQKRETLCAAGIDVDAALERLMGSDALLERFLKKFAADANYARLQAAFEQADRDGAIAASHTLKGMCGNLSMTALFDLFTRQVALLRADDWSAAAALMPDIAQGYEPAVQAIGMCFGS